ncbi:MAG: hypothetical protein HDT14_09195 [Oscillibacter sp.]|nr:hypothetical protein [Oscillibacter sp.]
MEDYSCIVKVVQETDVDRVQKYLDTQRWVILSIAPGQLPDRTAYQLFALGWYGPYDPEFPERDHSEFPLGDPSEKLPLRGEGVTYLN